MELLSDNGQHFSEESVKARWSRLWIWQTSGLWQRGEGGSRLGLFWGGLLVLARLLFFVYTNREWNKENLKSVANIWLRSRVTFFFRNDKSKTCFLVILVVLKWYSQFSFYWFGKWSMTNSKVYLNCLIFRNLFARVTISDCSKARTTFLGIKVL